jgi:glycosyltransferase involved in cell wall biosynthesis
MTIVHIGKYYSEKVDGVSVSVSTLAAEQVIQGHTVYFCYLSDKFERFTDEKGIIHIGLYSRQFKFRKKYLHLINRNDLVINIPSSFTRFVKSLPLSTVFHFHSVFILTNMMFGKVVVKLGRSYYVTPHGGYDPERMTKNLLVKKSFLHFFENDFLRNAKSLIAVSDNEQKYLLTQFPFMKCSVVYNSIKRFPVLKKYPNFLKSNSGNEFANTRDDFKTLLYVGRLNFHIKGIDRLLSIANSFKKLNYNIRIELVGSGPDEELIRNKIEELDLSKYVLLSGVLYKEQKINKFSTADGFMSLSRSEGLSMSIIEAVCARLPLFLSEECNFNSFISSYGGGVILNDFDDVGAGTINDLINNKFAENQTDISLNHMFNECFDSSRNCEKLTQVYLSHI